MASFQGNPRQLLVAPPELSPERYGAEGYPDFDITCVPHYQRPNLQDILLKHLQVYVPCSRLLHGAATQV